MSGTFDNASMGNGGYTSIANEGGNLSRLLLAQDIEPGTSIGYQTAKQIYIFHPLGGKMAEGPITLMQSQEREISVKHGPEELLIPAFKKEAAALGRVGMDEIIKHVMTLSRIYGISALAVGNREVSLSEPLQEQDILGDNLFFNILDPLNTAGSLILDQDPASPDFLKPTNVKVRGSMVHPSRTVVLMNEQPIYIQWESSAFGFSGRSVFQRALFPLKTYIEIMRSNQLIAHKAGLLIANMKNPTSAPNRFTQGIFNIKREKLKVGASGDVLSIGETEKITSLDLHNMEPVLRMARENCIKDIAASDNMPAALIEMESLTNGFGEGTEDAKNIARYIARKRIEANPIYDYLDQIVMKRAWNEDFYVSVQKAYPDEYGHVPYNTAFHAWKNSFETEWPNLLIEPDSKKAEAERDRFATILATWGSLAPVMDPENKSALAQWVVDQVNDSESLFTSNLNFDPDKMADYMPPGGDKTETVIREDI